MKFCARCQKPILPRKKFCSDSCKYWFNEIKKEREAHMAPAKKRTDQFFSMITGYEWAKTKGQGRRSGHMVKGGMAARVSVTVEKWAELNRENLIRHFNSVPSYDPAYVLLGNGERVKASEIKQRFKIE